MDGHRVPIGRTIAAIGSLAVAAALCCPVAGATMSASGHSEAGGTVSFADMQNGWLVGTNAEVRHTTDGGRTWKRQRLAWLPIGERMSQACATGQRTAIVVGFYGIFGTTDAGRTWKSLTKSLFPRPYTGANWKSCAFVSPSIGWAATAEGDVAYTRTAGRTWVWQSRGGKPLAGLTGNVLAVDAHHALISVTDTAANHLAGIGFGSDGWAPVTPVPLRSDNASVGAYAARTTTTFWIGTSGGELYASQDAGLSWLSLTGVDGVTGLVRGAFLSIGDSLIGYGQGPGGIAAVTVSRDGGLTWLPSRLPDSYRFAISTLDMVNDQQGFALTFDGVLLRTDDEARTWQFVRRMPLS